MAEVYCDVVPHPNGWVFVSERGQSPAYPSHRLALEAAHRHMVTVGKRRVMILREQGLNGRMKTIGVAPAEADKPQLMNAIAQTLGLTVDYREESDFSKIIPAIQAGTYNVGMSSFTDSKQREQQVDFVTYFSAGSLWAQRAGGQIDPNNACGKKVAVESTTVQDTEELPAKSKTCTDAGKPPIDVVKFDNQDQAANAVVVGQADAMSADSPVTLWAIKQANGKLVQAGEDQITDGARHAPRPQGPRAGWPGARSGLLPERLRARPRRRERPPGSRAGPGPPAGTGSPGPGSPRRRIPSASGRPDWPPESGRWNR